MNHLQYTSKEMFSSTELIRKSKMIFEKVSSKEIDKAIILRDGKPSFMLLDFATYEDMMSEYLALKEMFNKKELGKKETKPTKTIEAIETKEESFKQELPEIKEETKEVAEIKTNNDEIVIIEEKIPTKEITNIDEINDLDLEEALAKIDELEMNFEPKSDDVEIEEINKELENLKEQNQEKEPLKEFWE